MRPAGLPRRPSVTRWRSYRKIRVPVRVLPHLEVYVWQRELRLRWGRAALCVMWQDRAQIPEAFTTPTPQQREGPGRGGGLYGTGGSP